MGANLGVLASLMQSMAEANNIRPWDVAEKSMNEAQTGLLQLQEMKRQQETAARTRQFLQEHPEILLGQGGGSVLGSLQQPPAAPPGGSPMPQQSIVPGQAPGAPAVVPGGQDLSRFAGVSPQGGGPIPPNVMGQTMPTVTPPQGQLGGSVLASLGGQPQGQMQALQNRFLLDLARTSPDAAMQVQQLMQGQQQYQSRLEEQRLDWTSKKMGYFGQVLQGVNSPESYSWAVQEIGRVDAQAAARLPQTYNKEALIPYIKQATTVKENADLQIRTMHEQTEQGKLQVQLAQAGYQGLGESTTSILRGLTDEQVKQFGGRTTPAAVAYATEQGRKVAALSPAIKTELEIMKVSPLEAKPEQLAQAQKNIQDRELAKAGEAERLKFDLEQGQKKTMALQDARKEDSGLFVYAGTGKGVEGTKPYGDVMTLQNEADPDKRVVKLGNLDEKKQLTNLKQLEPVLQQYSALVQYAYGPGGPMENYTRSPQGVFGAAFRQALQTDPKLEGMRRSLMGQLQSLVRGLGARGDLNEQELKAATEMIANFDASGGLGLSLGPMVGPSGVGLGASFKPTLSIPDTPQVGLELANNLIENVNSRIGSLTQHEQYAKTPKITLAAPGTSPAATVPPRTWGTMQPATPGQPTPPAPGQGTAPAAPPTFGPGDPTQQLGPRQTPPVPPGTPAPPTATSTPAQDEAYRRSQGQGRPPAPAAPTPRPTPGRQSQAPTGTRLAGAPKFMNQSDVVDAMAQTGRSRAEVEKAARSRGFTVYGSKLPLTTALA